MGAHQTKNSVDIVNEVIIDVVVSSMNKCTNELVTTNHVKIRGFSFFTWFSQSGELNVKCIQSSKISSDMATTMATKIQQVAKETGIALNPSYDKSENTYKLANHIQTNLKLDLSNKCNSKIINTNDIDVDGFVIGNRTSQIIKAVSVCIQTAVQDSKISNDIVADASQTADVVVNSPFDFLTNIWTVAIVGFFIVIIVVAYFLFGPSGSAAQIVVAASGQSQKTEK
jgi:hypothetical protein